TRGDFIDCSEIIKRKVGEIESGYKSIEEYDSMDQYNISMVMSIESLEKEIQEILKNMIDDFDIDGKKAQEIQNKIIEILVNIKVKLDQAIDDQYYFLKLYK